MEKGTSSSNQSPSSGGSFLLSSTNFRPSWLLTNLAELEERMKTLTLNKPEESDKGDTFAERAEAYYKNRPQLLELLQDLYNAYLSLSDRYVQALAKSDHHHKQSEVTQIESDSTSIIDNLIAELVIKNVELDVLAEEASLAERRCSESARKVELQRSLLEVLESERLVLLNENVRLGQRVTSLSDENEGLASESEFMQRRAGELTRCVLKMREDHRVFMLSRKIEDLEGKVFGLEKTNQEYYDLITGKEGVDHMEMDQENKLVGNYHIKKKKNVGSSSGLSSCFQIRKERLKKKKNDDGNGDKKVSSSWWGRVKKMELDLFVCGSSLQLGSST